MLIEGPYGAFTQHARTTEKVALIGAGVGITPLRALLEDLPASVDATVVVRASKPDDIVLRHELKELVRQRDGDYHEVVGSRHKIRFDERALRKLVPDIDGRDVYICGPGGFNEMVLAYAAQLGVPREHIHQEAFSF